MTRRISDIFAAGFDRRPLAVRPYLIAEAGVNHGGSMELARRLVDEAAAGGADAIKFQTYKAETLAMRHSPAYWDLTQESTTSQFELFKKYDTFGAEQYEELKAYCDNVGIEFMSTPFDLDAAKAINELVEVHKISSSDITNRPLIELIASFGKPILLSTGASDLTEVQQAVDWIDAAGAPVALLHCVLNYPTADEDANLGRIVTLREEFSDRPIGYSDHTLPGDLEPLVIAAGLGAVVLEKHFTYDKNLPGNDHYHALDEGTLKRQVERLERAVLLTGRFDMGYLESEEVSRQHARRSLVAAVDIPAGSVIEESHLIAKRPGHGISPSSIDEVIGRRATKLIAADTALSWDQLG